MRTSVRVNVSSVGELSDALLDFVRLVSINGRALVLLLDDLRYPAGDSGTLRGSQHGAELWSSTQGERLLDLAANDSEVLDTFGGSWFPRWESRQILASAVVMALSGHMTLEQYTTSVERELWRSLRRQTTVATAAIVVEHFVVSAQRIDLGFGRSFSAPDENLLQFALSRGWASYSSHMPAGPFSMWVSRVEVPRRLFGGGWIAQGFARTAIWNMRDAVWLATGVIPNLGSGVTWEEGPFTITDPTRVEPEPHHEDPQPLTDLSLHHAQLRSLTLRLEVIGGGVDSPNDFDLATYKTLVNVRDQAHAAMETARPDLSMLLAYSATNGSLRGDGWNATGSRRTGLVHT
jgi:hypothetical protein